MRKQTKLVAVLSTAALLAIGASMTSFAAQGWAEEDGTWVYYDRDGEKVTNEWKRSGDNWFWLDDNGEMAIDQLIEDDDDYYYVNESGAMVANQWVAIENEDAGEEDEPEAWWYYFQANGKAYTDSGNSDNASWKLINGKYYTFDEDGKMQYGWLTHDGERQTGDDDWAQSSGGNSDDAMYYCGDENDGARSTGWRQISIYDEDWDPDEYDNGDIFDEDQERWFYFKSNGARVQSDDKTINGKKYQFDEYGRMLPMWVYDGTATRANEAGSVSDSRTDDNGDEYGTNTNSGQGVADYSHNWKYFGDPEDGARVTKGWFKVVPSEFLHYSKSEEGNNEDYWYYSDGSGNLYTNEIKTIKGKKYAFDSYGRMMDGLRILKVEGNTIVESYNTDVYDTEDEFDAIYNELFAETNTDKDSKAKVYTYYFGDADDGAMKTGTQTINVDGDDLTFVFEKDGSKKGRGKMGYDNDDKKCYIGGKVTKADSDEKYELVVEFGKNASQGVRQYSVSEAEEAFELDTIEWVDPSDKDGDTSGTAYLLDGMEKDINEDGVLSVDMSKKDNYDNSDYSLLKTIQKTKAGKDATAVYVVNTSGVAQDHKKSKNGDEFYIASTKRTGAIPDVRSIFSED